MSALDRVIDSTLETWRIQQRFDVEGWVDEPETLDQMLRDAVRKYGSGPWRRNIRADPRYIAHCEEQDRQEQIRVGMAYRVSGATYDESLGDLGENWYTELCGGIR